jgi:hypothetical protein
VEGEDSTASLKAFLRAFGERWFTAMCGPLTVPFAVLALYMEQKYLKLLFGILAVLCMGFSSYWIWKREREARCAAEELLEPKLEILFGEGPPFEDTIQMTPANSKLNFFKIFRVGVKNISGTEIFGVQVEFEGFTWGKHSFDCIPLRLWNNTLLVPATSFDLRPHQVKYVDVAMRALLNPSMNEEPSGILLCFTRTPSHRSGRIGEKEKHRLTIAAYTSNAKSCRKDFLLYVDDSKQLRFEPI